MPTGVKEKMRNLQFPEYITPCGAVYILSPCRKCSARGRGYVCSPCDMANDCLLSVRYLECSGKCREWYEYLAYVERKNKEFIEDFLRH